MSHFGEGEGLCLGPAEKVEGDWRKEGYTQHCSLMECPEAQWKPRQQVGGR